MQHVLNTLPRALRDQRVLLLTLAAITIAVVACRGGGSNPSENDQDLPLIQPTVSQDQCIDHLQPADGPQFDGLDLTQLQVQEPSLRVYDIEQGTGESPTIQDAVSVEYTGWLEDGCMFDTSYISGGPVTLPLIGVIPGWQQGFSTMQEGGTRILEIGPDLAYRATGFLPAIPPNATLIFHVKLIARVTFAEAQATIESAQTEAATAVAATATALSGQGDGSPTATP